jgi:16S rRNA (cytosine1402-N4)-methyltransferase
VNMRWAGNMQNTATYPHLIPMRTENPRNDFSRSLRFRKWDISVHARPDPYSSVPLQELSIMSREPLPPPETPPHIPVMQEEVLSALAPVEGGHYIDGTFGAGGYTSALLNSAPDVRVLAIDRDPRALRLGSSIVEHAQNRLTLVEGCFGDLDVIAHEHSFAPVHGIVLDIGVSSMQIDEAERGFSFMHEGPLDMRMSQSGQSAEDLINKASESALADIFYYFGEERLARVVAKAIVAARLEAPIHTTKHLAQIISKVVRSKPNAIHPATRSFQALRIAVNDELGELARALHAAERTLAPEGRLVVVTFHSLEDRIVKHFFATRSGKTGGQSRHVPIQEKGPDPTFHLVGKQPLTATDAESHRNPRARSAKLRVAQRTFASFLPEDESVMMLSQIPQPVSSKRRST